jgi:uncharacterized protein (DUF58 family)
VSLAPLAPQAVSAPLHSRSRVAVAFARRFVLLWAVGLLGVIPGFWNPTFIYAIAVWDGVLLAAWLLDLYRLPRPSQITAARCWATPLCIGVPARVEVSLRTHDGSAIECTLIDEVPVELRAAPPMAEIRVIGPDEAGAGYDVLPRERGDIQLRSLFVRYRTRLQLAEQWAVADLRQTVRVYPNFEHAKGNSIYLTRSRQIELEKRLLRKRGQGREFESLREYREGDELREICWTATARRGKLVTKVHQIERSQPVWIVLDSGRLMRIRTGAFSKLDYCVDAALSLAGLAMYSGDRVGLLAYGRRVNQRVGLGGGASQLREFVEQLAVVHAEPAEADHLRAASTLLSMQKRRALIVWLTDLAETAMVPEVVEAAGQMLSRHLLLFMVMGDTALAESAASRPANVEQMYCSAAAQDLVYRRELLLGKLRERGALALEVAPGKLSPILLNQYLGVKERNLL